MIRKYLEKVLKGYQKAKKENFENHQMAKLITDEFPNFLSQITPDAEKYKFMSNTGKKTADTSWTCCPTNAILNSAVTTAIGKGYFVIYIFSQDTKRAYLSLNQGIQYGSMDQLKENAIKLRKKLGIIPKEFNLESISLGDPAFFGRYQIANICARCYNLDNLPSEEELQSDYLEMLKLYDKISSQNESLKIIENPQEIKEAQKKFLEILYQNADEIITTDKIRIGRSNQFGAKSYWSNDLGFWILNRELEGNHYLNAFGIEKPDNTIVNAICEINFEKEHTTRRTGGAFAKDLEGNVYIIHRGNVGGKKKDEFFDKYTGKTAQIQDGSMEIDAIIMGSLNDPKLPEKVRDFVFEVAKIKGLVNESPKIWSISPGSVKLGEQDRLWPLYKQRGFIGIGWLHDSHSYLEFGNIDELKEALIEFHPNYKKTDPTQAAKMVWDFAHNIKKGDIIVANSGFSEIKGIGIVTSDYIDPTNPENPGIFDYFWHLRKISWKITDDLELNQNTFIRNTLAELNENKWNYIKKAYSKKDPKYAELFKQMENNSPISNNFDEESIEIIHSLFKEFSDNYLDTEIGVKHLELHSKEREEVKKYFNKIKNDPKIVYDDSNPIINYILPIKRFSVAPAGVKNFSAFKNPVETIPKITLDVFQLITDLINNDDKQEQSRLIHSFKDKNYRGFQSGILTSVFYYLNSDLWYINNKTVNTFNFISGILGNDDKINGNLNDYIDNLSKIKKLLNKISIKIPELSDFEVFDVFCHWMCDKNLGAYAIDKEKFEKWLHREDFDVEDSGIIIKPTYNSFNDYLNKQNFLYTPEMIENFLLSLKVKPFVILTGNSGTGKTKIAQLFAEYLQQKNEGDFIIIPVGANWTENRHLMGFYNVITQDYQSTPALDLMIKARDDPLKPYFLILDEMNLSHVERYFSDFLSAIESEKEISLYSPPENAEDMQNSNIPEKIKIPHNLFVIGTVNVDETTYMFSPKVLDRANTIEFKTYPAMDYIMCQIEPELPLGSIEYLENPLSHQETRKSKIIELKNEMEHITVPHENKNLWEVLALEIHSFQEVLSEAGFDFGFRVIDEVMRFMYASWLYENSPNTWDNWQRYFDAQIMQKTLPKLHGSQQELNSVLEKLFKLCYNGESMDKSWYIKEMDLNDLNYPSSALKLQKMARRLHEKRFVSFTD